MIEIKKNIYWTGIRDWELRQFHGHELSTHRGSTYNSYLVRDEKTALVDTVWDPYKDDFLEMLDKNIGLQSIDYIVINHVEPDHGGSLGHIMSRIPNTPIYCTKNGAEIIRKTYHQDWDFRVVKTGDTLKLGEYELVFVEMQMLHWPDSMMTYVKGANVALSNDAFGQHYASLSLFNDETDTCELYQEAIKYYANILAPFSPLIKKKVEEIRAMNLPIDMIAPSHGVIWRTNPMQIVDKYYEWSQNYNEGFVAIIYDTMYNATKAMAGAIAEGLALEGVRYKIYNASISDESDLITDMFRAKGVIIGSCTVNNTVLRPVIGILEEIKSHKLKGKYAAGFGSYGWSGEAHKLISQKLGEAGLHIIAEPLGLKYRPTAEELQQCVEYGRNFARNMK